jgi:hypothetical protein
MSFRLTRNLSLIGPAIILAACNGAQGVTSAVPQSSAQGHAMETPSYRSGSWMLPEAKADDLLYTSDFKNDSVYAYSYPNGKLVGRLTEPARPGGLCTNAAGDIFVTLREVTKIKGHYVLKGHIYEYSHGGSTPIAILRDAGIPEQCAVNSANGNLAVTNFAAPGGRGNVVVYQGTHGSRKTYTDPRISTYFGCSYDDKGNLYVTSGYEPALAELRNGEATLINIDLDMHIPLGSVRWDGRDVELENMYSRLNPGPTVIYKIRISKASGTVVGTIRLVGEGRGFGPIGAVQFAVHDDVIVQPDGADRVIDYWRYPEGGNSVKTIRGPRGAMLYGVAISFASD